jgi:hypothetical protein
MVWTLEHSYGQPLLLFLAAYPVVLFGQLPEHPVAVRIFSKHML